MKCKIILHFIEVFTVCQSICLGVSSIQRVKIFKFCSLVSGDVACVFVVNLKVLAKLDFVYTSLKILR